MFNSFPVQTVERISRIEKDIRELFLRLPPSNNVGSFLIQDTALLAAAANITFSSIPSTYSHLRMIYFLRSDRAATTDQIRLRLNGDAGANYEWTQFTYAHSSIYATVLGTGDSALTMSFSTGNTAAAGYFAAGFCDVYNYLDASQKKYLQSRGGLVQDLATSFPKIYDGSLIWTAAAAAINQLTIFPNAGANWMAGSRITLYGMK